MKITKPKVFTVVRKRWYRGTTSGSKLRRSGDKKQCCLGFYAISCGMQPKHITDVCSPAGISNSLPVLPGVSVVGSGHINTIICEKMMLINDDDKIPDLIRESELRRLFRRIGVTVKFK